MLRALRAARRLGVRVGGIRVSPTASSSAGAELVRSEDDVFADCVAQTGALLAPADTWIGRFLIVKPHGALYNQACQMDAYARPVAAAAAACGLRLLGCPARRLAHFADTLLRCEGFADRRYRPTVVGAAHEADAFISDVDNAVASGRMAGARARRALGLRPRRRAARARVCTGTPGGTAAPRFHVAGVRMTGVRVLEPGATDVARRGQPA